MRTNNIFKRRTAVFLALIMAISTCLFAFSGCGKTSDTPGNPSASVTNAASSAEACKIWDYTEDDAKEAVELSASVTEAGEKVDIVLYSVNPALYIIDALRPASVIAIAIDKENRQAVAIVENEKLRLAVGRRGSNARLAAKLTDFKIDVKEEENMEEYKAMGYVFKTVEEVKEEEEVRVRQETYNRYLANVKAQRAAEEEEQAPVSLGGIEKHKIS